jgi:replicative DNA helicase
MKMKRLIKMDNTKTSDDKNHAMLKSQVEVIFLAEKSVAEVFEIAIRQIKEEKQLCNAIAIGIKETDIVLKEFKKEIEKITYKQPFVLVFDNSKQQQNINKRVMELLKMLEIEHVSIPFAPMREKGFKVAILDITKMADKCEFGVVNKSLNDNNAYKQTEAFIENLASCANAPSIKTGFDKFDEALGGGLRAGRLYGIGAITSLGKTTFALQMADNIARAGQDILIFSLEMSRYELMGKSVSRGTYIKNRNKSVSLQSILDTKERDTWDDEKRIVLAQSIADYRDNVAKYINIIEGVGDIGVERIRKSVEEFCAFKSSNPPVIIDYLQILAPFNDRLNDKQNIDKNVLELKRICRDYQVPVIVVNSFNRANYLSEASFEAFKESGAIEYSCDVLIALQLSIKGRDEWTETKPTINEKREAVNNAKIKSPRDIEAIILKNRGYKAYDKISFQYLPEYDYFAEYDNL